MKLLVVDDHPIVREGLSALLRQLGDEPVILQAHDAREGLDLVDRHPDLHVVILDLMMPGAGGHAALTEFARKRPTLPVIILSSSEDQQDARKAFALGAVGYVPKSASDHTLLTAIRLVMNGDLYIPPLILGKFQPNAPVPLAGSTGADTRLTARQLEVLHLLSKGHSNKAIAASLDIAEKTVKVHVTTIFRALNTINRTQAVNVARDRGLI